MSDLKYLTNNIQTVLSSTADVMKSAKKTQSSGHLAKLEPQKITVFLT